MVPSSQKFVVPIVPDGLTAPRFGTVHVLSCRFVKKGDSGGPLIQKGSDATGADDILVGIVSWGLGCADESFPGGTCTLDIRCS